MRLLPAALVLSLFAGPAAASEAVVDRMALKARVEALVRDTKTATWYQDVWISNGKDTETTAADCFWRQPDQVRLNVKKGRGSGATAVYKDGKVTGFQPGMFSFVKLTYDVRDKEVLSIRGQDIRSNGFLDDYALILTQWETVTVLGEGGKFRLSYQNAEGLAAQMTVDAETLQPSLVEAAENGKVVERMKYTNVIFNPALEAKLFNP